MKQVEQIDEDIDFQTSTVTSDSEGRWFCPYIPKDFEEINFVLTHNDYAVTLPIVKIGQVDLTNLQLVVARGFTVTGRITDEAGLPIAEAVVKESGDSGGYHRHTTKTDVNGTFIMRGLRDASHSFYFIDEGGIREIPAQPFRLATTDINLAVQAKGFAASEWSVHLSEPTNFAKFVLIKGNVFRGRILDEGDTPIPDAVVQTSYDDEGRRKYDWAVRTDAEGRFEWDSAPMDSEAYCFEANGYTVIGRLPLFANGSEHEIRLKRKTDNY